MVIRTSGRWIICAPGERAMRAAGWWNVWNSKRSRRSSEQRRKHSREIAIESLEDRRLLSGIQLAQSVYRIAEGTRTLDVTLTREDWTSGSDSVLIVETGGTATGGGSDYWNGAFPVNAIFQPGEREVTVTLIIMSPRGGQLLEGVETVELGLVDNDHYNVTFGEQKTATIEIHDAFLSVESDFQYVLEDGGPHRFDVVLNMADGLALAEDAVFEVSVSNGVLWAAVLFEDGIRRGAVSPNDYVLNTDQIRFAAGSRNGAKQTITLTPISDSVEEGIEGFYFELTQISGPPFIDHVRTPGRQIIDVPPERISNRPFTGIPLPTASRFDNDIDRIVPVPADPSAADQSSQVDVAPESDPTPPAQETPLETAAFVTALSFPVIVDVPNAGIGSASPDSLGRMDVLAEFLDSQATGPVADTQPGLVHAAFSDDQLLDQLLAPSI